MTATKTVPSTTPKLNKGQQAAKDGFYKFLFSDEREMAITGPGGVGKTFTMGNLIDESLPQYYDTCKLMGISPEYDSVNMTATTNKATEVLSLASGRPTDTIHSFLGLRVRDDFSTGRSVLTKGRNWQVHSRKIVFIDEYSLIDTPLINCIDEGLHKSKIVYVGDHCQLAPVMEKVSPVTRRPMPIFELLEPVRNAEQPALMHLCDQLRSTVVTGQFRPISLVPGVIEHLDDSGLEKALHDDFMNQTHDARILTYTNQRVLQYNDHIRSNRNLPDEYTTGEFLINNTAIALKGSKEMLSVEEEVEIVGMSNTITKERITNDVSLEVRRATLVTRLGREYTDVPIPVDRNHFSELRKYYARQKNWDRYFYLGNNFPDLRQRDACTVYKAQGSTYEKVYIDVGNISTCNKPDQVARMLYVAASRAKTKIYLYGKLSDKYGGIIGPQS